VSGDGVMSRHVVSELDYVAKLKTTVDALSAEYGRLDVGEGASLECLRDSWLVMERGQYETRSRHSSAALAFLCYIRRLSEESPPCVTEIDGEAMIALGIITATSLVPAKYIQTEVMDSIRAIRSRWAAACACRGLVPYLEALVHRTAILACFTHDETVLDDGSYSRPTNNANVNVASFGFILDTECFFRDALVQLQWCAEAVSATALVTEANVATVTVVAHNSIFHCIIAYANRSWFKHHWELMLSPGERDAYHRARPSLKDDARSVIALFRGHELTTGVSCNEETLRMVDDVRSVLSLCERHWGKDTVFVRNNSSARTGPSLRFACGTLLLVDVHDIVGGTAFELITLFLLRVRAFVDSAATARKRATVGAQTSFSIAE
jgi:hypothetical protein